LSFFEHPTKWDFERLGLELKLGLELQLRLGADLGV